jgi:protein-S-isoprenylcysteine O-methyltransferase Ste14
MNKPIQPYLLVFIQFACITFFIVYCGVIAKGLIWKTVQVISILLAFFAIFSMRLHNFSVFPKPKQGSLLITSGPYKFIRHPTYTAVLLFCFSLLNSRFDMYTTIAFAVLLVDLLLKLRYEEMLLIQRFPEYGEYIKNSYRLIPFIY